MGNLLVCIILKNIKFLHHLLCALFIWLFFDCRGTKSGNQSSSSFFKEINWKLG